MGFVSDGIVVIEFQIEFVFQILSNSIWLHL